LEAYRGIPQTSTYHSLSDGRLTPGLDYVYEVSGRTLTIRIDVGSYNLVTYAFDEGDFQSVMMQGTRQSSVYGAPVLPYKNLLLTIPDNAEVLDVDVFSIASEEILDLNLAPGPVPVAIYEGYTPDPKLFFNPDIYEKDTFLKSEIIEYRVVKQRGTEGLFITVNPLQYNPVKDRGILNSEIIIEVTFDAPITLDDLPWNGGGDPVGTNYTVVIKPGFESAIEDFVDWKTSLGYNMFVETTDDIYASYAGYDTAESLRLFIKSSYEENQTAYVFLIGDGDVVPAREVVDPYWGPGIDNGTEPSDLYFECLDGDWDANGNHQYGELNDSVDFFPELMVGRIPVQTPAEAERVLSLITQYENNPVSGDWMDNFMLIANDCFGIGDGDGMLEGVLNQKYLMDSFFDVSRFYSSDELSDLPDTVTDASLGCGNPIAIAELQPGEVVAVDTHWGIERKTAVVPSEHPLCIIGLEQAAAGILGLSSSARGDRGEQRDVVAHREWARRLLGRLTRGGPVR